MYIRFFQLTVDGSIIKTRVTVASTRHTINSSIRNIYHSVEETRKDSLVKKRRNPLWFDLEH